MSAPFAKKPERPFTGASVRNRRLIYSSVSQVALFDPETEGCNRKWAFQYVFGKKLAKTDAQGEGTDHGAALEHYFKTGEDVLTPVLQHARKFFPIPGPDLEVEQPLCVDTVDSAGKPVYMGGLLRAIELRERLLRTSDAGERARILAEMRDYAGLLAADIPIDGAADFRHFRGEYLDEEGVLRREHPSAIVVETNDLKTTSRIDSHKIKKGQNAGMILPGRAKTAAQICDHVQMLGYSVSTAHRRPDVTHFRMSHVYAQTEGKKAVKRTGIISRDELLLRWAQKEAVVLQMDQAAGAQKIEDVAPNVNACGAYTHVSPTDGKTTLPGCGHRYYCPLSSAQVSVNLLGYHPQEFEAMSLFDQLSIPGTNGVPAPAPPPSPAAPPPTDAEHAAAVAAEKAKLLASLAPAPPTQAAPSASLGFCPACGVQLTVDNTSRLRDSTVKHIGCVGASAPPPPPGYGPVTPPDAPALDPIASADPVPQAEIDKISNPALKERVEEHARLHAERAKQEEEQKQRENGTLVVWCAGGLQRIKVDIETVLVRKCKYICKQCGKEVKLRPAKEGEDYYATVPKHKPVEQAAPASTPAAPLVSGESLSPPPPPAPPAPPAPPPPPAPPQIAVSLAPEPAPVLGGIALTAPEIDVLAMLFRDRASAMAPHLGDGARALLSKLRIL